MENETLNIPKEMDKRIRREFSPKAKKEEQNANVRTQLRDMNVQIFQNHGYTFIIKIRVYVCIVYDCIRKSSVSNYFISILEDRIKSIALVKCQ